MSETGIYAYRESPKTPSLVINGLYVVNGDYKVTADDDGNLLDVRGKPLVWLMNAPDGNGYNDVLRKADLIMVERRLTKNQQMLLRYAKRKKGKWIETKGMCNAGGFSGRGLHFSFPKLVKLGLIETALGEGAFIKYRYIGDDNE